MADRVSVGCPVVGEFYTRPRAPELDSGKAYSPFKLDVWQLGQCLLNFKVRHYIFFSLFFLLIGLSLFRALFPQLMNSGRL